MVVDNNTWEGMSLFASKYSFPSEVVTEDSDKKRTKEDNIKVHQSRPTLERGTSRATKL